MEKAGDRDDRLRFGKDADDGELSVQLTEDQRKAVEVTDGNVVVTAGAGTGKTAVLVARFINLVRAGLAEVNEILTITFTEKAAEEMKERIAREFRDLGMTKEKTAVETSYISTIHSFCSRVIRENPFSAGVDPGFEVMDEMDRQLMLGGLFEELFSEGGEDFLELAEHYGESAIRGAITRYMDLCRSMGRGIEHVEKLLAGPEVMTENAQAAADNRAEGALRETRRVVEKLFLLEATGSCEDRRQEVMALRDSLADVASFRGAAEALASATGRMPVVPKKGESRAACLEVRGLLSQLATILKEEKAAILFDREAEEALLPCKVALLKGVSLFWGKYEGRKRDRGVLDYEDLQLIARGLLRDTAALHREYMERFRYVLVDEFQDINWLQKELIDLLTSGKNLFVVGDTRQSIYGFRNADVDIFEGLVERCRTSSRTHFSVSLRENFRSGENLIAFFNFFFSGLWGEVEPGFDALRYSRKGGEEPATASVEIMVFGKEETCDGTCEDAEAVRQREARSVVARVAKAVEGKEISVYDPAIQGARAVEYGDVAVLCRTRASYSAYAEAFGGFGVPFCTVGGQSFYDKQEVADLINLLRVIDNPLRDIPLVATLRSPFVGVKDETLLRLRRHVRSTSESPYVLEAIREAAAISDIDAKEKEKLLGFMALLNGLRKKKDSIRLHELAKGVVDSSAYLTRTVASPGGAQKAANVWKFLEVLREYDAKEGGGIGGFLRFYEVMREYGPQEEEAVLEPFSGDAVKLMTIHAAKGLEFPVVVLADMARRFNFDTDRFLTSREMEIGCDSWEESAKGSCGRKLVLDERKERQLAEEKRLVYVAMTRARDHLILAGGYRPEKECSVDKASCPMDWLMAVAGRGTELPEPGGTLEARLGGARVCISVDPLAEECGRARRRGSMLERYRERIAAGEEIPVDERSREKLLPGVEEVLERVASGAAAEPWSAPAEVSVSQLMLFEECPYRFFLREMLKLPDREVMTKLGLYSGGRSGVERDSLPVEDEWRAETGGREFGERVHACLEQVDFRAAETEHVGRITGRFFSSTEDANAAEKLILRFLDGDEGKRLRKAKKLYREIAVKGAVSGVILSGIIDVLYLDDENCWTLLDFKTGTMPEETASQQRAYDFQMLLYVFLVEKATGTRPKRAIIYYLASGVSRSVSTEIAELEWTKARVAEIIEDMGKGEFKRAKGDTCEECECRAVCRPEEHGLSSGMEENGR